jgi:hypothetical protein
MTVMFLEGSDAADADWRAFEQLVAQHVADTNPGAIVEHDQHLPGRHSGVPRQVDVLARSEYEGQTVTAVYECKHYGRSVSLGTVEEFIGKLGDLAVDRGVLCVFGGITDAALRRLCGVTHPRVDLLIWRRPELLYGYMFIGTDGEERWEPVYEGSPSSFL